MPAIVLSGGGAKGAFEVGAVRFLYNQNIRPNIVCGVSVGSINAIKLAEGENAQNPLQGLPGLEAIWASLSTNDDMYKAELWLSDPRLHPAVRDLITGRSGNLSVAPPAEQSTWGDISVLISSIARLSWLLDDGVKILESLDLLAKATAVYNLNPIRDKLAAQIDMNKVAAWGAAGNRLRLGMVGLESGRLRWATERGDIVEDDGRAVLDFGRQICVAERNSVESIEADILSRQDDFDSPRAPSKAVTAATIRGLKNQLETARKALATCLSTTPNQPQPASADLRRAVIASASMPGIFPPVGIAGETYVDGGVREVIPVRQALRLGADVVYAIGCSSLELSPRPPGSFARAQILDIVARALTEIAINEISRNDQPAQGEVVPVISSTTINRGGLSGGGTISGPNLPGIPLPFPGTPVPRPTPAALPKVVSIFPTFDFYSTTTIDPGLIQINRDYGFMRAADSVAGVSASSRQWDLSDRIAGLRTDIWFMENSIAGRADPRRPDLPAPPPNPAGQTTINANKQSLAQLLTERRTLAGGGSMPADVFYWTTNPERHP